MPTRFIILTLLSVLPWAASVQPGAATSPATRTAPSQVHDRTLSTVAEDGRIASRQKQGVAVHG